MINPKRTLATLALAAAIIAGAGQAAKADLRDFQVENYTQDWIVGLWFAPHFSNEPWSPIPLDTAVGPMESTMIEVTGGNECNFDVFARFHDGSEARWDNVDFCSTGRITVH